MQLISQTMGTLQPQDSNQVAPKVIYTSKEVIDKNIPFSSPLPEPKKCKFCGNALFYEGIFLFGQIRIWNKEPQRCSCEKAIKYWEKYDSEQEQRKKAEELTEKHQLMNEKIQRLIGNSGIKKRFISRTFNNFIITNENKKAFNTAKKYADEFLLNATNGKGIYFEGTYGTGKTHLAIAIALELLQQGIPVICKTSIDMLADIKRSYDESTRYDEYQVLDVYKKVDLLIIDDLGKEQCTEWSMPIIYTILNDRYEELRPTIITTNYNEEMLIKRLTPKSGDSSNVEAIISRLHECNDVVTMAWNDYRGGDLNV